MTGVVPRGRKQPIDQRIIIHPANRTVRLAQKLARQREILRLVRTEHVRTQAGLRAALNERGYTVSQPTLSKDIAELGLVKAPSADSGYRYQLPASSGGDHQGRRLVLTLREFAEHWERAGQVIVIKTVTGHAAGVAFALDDARWPEILGTVAGEDTVLVISRTPAEARKALRHLEQVLQK